MGESNRWNNYAISTADLAVSLTKSSGALVAANGTLEEAVALTAAANTIIQDADVVGTALKTVSMRLRGTSVKEMEEEGLDTEGVVTQSKLQSQIKAISGVDILTDTGAYKSTYQILEEISEVWDDITDDKARAGLLELLAGKRSGSVMAAILENPDTLKDAFESASNAEGSALEENEKYLDSIQGRIDLFNNSVQTLWNNTLDDDVVKSVVDLGTELIKIVDKFGLIKTLVVAIGTLLIKKHFKGDLFGGLTKEGGPLFQSMNQIKKNFEDIKKVRDKAEAELSADPTNKNKQKAFKKANKKLDHYEENVSPKIKEYDELSEKLKEYRIESQNAKKELDAFNQKLSKKKSPVTDKDLAKQDELNKKFTESNQRVAETEDAMKKVEVQANTTGNAGLGAGQKISKGFKAGAKAVGNFAKQIATSMLTMYAITALFEVFTNIGTGIKDYIDGQIETVEEAQDKFEELKSELSSVESELKNLNSELDNTKERIDELLEKGSLSFTEQEELERLQKENDELERKIKLNETLQESLQKGVNAASVNANNKYLDTSFISEQSKTERQEKASETGGKWGQGAGLGLGAIIGTFIAPGIGTAIGAGIGALIGEPIGEAVGSSIEGAAYDSEQTVKESLDNMLSQRNKLKKSQDDALASGDTESYNKATEALNAYDKQMAQHINQIQATYNAMDWDSASTEQRQEMIEYADWLDTYSIAMGTTGAKTNAIERIFGDEADEQLKRIKKEIEEAVGASEEFDIASMFDNTEAYEAFMKRMHNMGLTVYEVGLYFKDQKQAADEAINDIETYDAIKEIKNLTAGVNELRNAFKEFHEEGMVSAETLLGLEGTFGHLGDTWKNFFEIMSSGTATMEQAQEAAEDMAEAYVDDLISTPGKYSSKQRTTYISHLQSLGITNAQEFLDSKVKKNMVGNIAQKVATGGMSQDEAIKAIEEEYGIRLDNTNDILLVEKAITAEKAKQNKEATISANTAYETAINTKSAYDELNKADQNIIDKINNGDYNLSELGITSATRTTGRKGKGKKSTKWYYNGQSYSSKKDALNAVKADIQTRINERVVEIPTEVTDVDVTNANEVLDKATKEYQEELDNHGFEVQINLIDKNELIDEAQNIFDSLSEAAREYEEEGYVSVDTLQSLLQLEPKYLALLYDENGQLNLNKESMYQLTVARITDMGIQQAQSVIDAARNALIDGNIEKLKELTEVTYGQADANWNLVTSNLALLKTEMTDAGVDDSIYTGIESQVFAIKDLTETTIANIGNSISSNVDNTAKGEADNAFQKAMEYWENRIEANQAKYDQIQNEIDLFESKGQTAGKEYYEEQVKLEKERQWLLEQQRKEARAYLKEIEDAGSEGSEEWWEVAKVLNDIEDELDDVTASIVDLQDAMANVDLYKFEEFNNRLDDITSKLSTIRDLIAPNGEEDWFDDEGGWTEKGVAVLGSYLQELESFKEGFKNTTDELNKYTPSYSDNKAYYETLGIHSEQEYYDKVDELTNKQHEFAKSISDTEQSVVDMYESNVDAIEEYTQTLIDSYNDYIDNVKEALDAERDLYEFKKNVQKQTKDIMALERRVASLSGSTNAADIAERRRLEADLYESRESLNDTYYQHSKESQQEALEQETRMYEETMNNFVEGLRTSLDIALTDMDSFLNGVAASVIQNAPAILEEYNKIGIALDSAIISPWEEASKAINGYINGGGENLGLKAMDAWTKEGGFFGKFKSGATTALTSPWSSGLTAMNSFKTDISTVMSQVVSDISTNVKTASGELSKLYQQIEDTDKRAAGSGTYDTPTYTPAPKKKYYTTATLKIGGKTLSVTKSDVSATTAMSAAKVAILGEYEKLKGNSITAESAWQRTWRNKVEYETDYYAKGTLGTKKDGFAVTDEPWLGDELVLVPGKNGNLQYMRAGTAVMPADISANLVEWGKINPNMLNIGDGGANINMISNAINKPEIKLDIENFLKVDRVDKDTLPQLEALMDKKIDTFAKQLNYSLGKFAK